MKFKFGETRSCMLDTYPCMTLHEFSLYKAYFLHFKDFYPYQNALTFYKERERIRALINHWFLVVEFDDGEVVFW